MGNHGGERMKASTGVRRKFIMYQYVRVIGRQELMSVDAIRDGLLFIGGKWWPVWLVEAA
jgi:hypothetical protein